MPDPVYKQTLDIVVTAVTSLADTSLMPNAAPMLTRLISRQDWENIKQQMGLHVCYVEGLRPLEDYDTNDRNVRSYPCPVIYIAKRRAKWDDRLTNIETMKQSVRRYFQDKRRMSGVSDTGTNELTCSVTEETPRPPSDVDMLDYDIHGLTVWAHFIEPRTA